MPELLISWRKPWQLLLFNSNHTAWILLKRCGWIIWRGTTCLLAETGEWHCRVGYSFPGVSFSLNVRKRNCFDNVLGTKLFISSSKVTSNAASSLIPPFTMVQRKWRQILLSFGIDMISTWYKSPFYTGQYSSGLHGFSRSFIVLLNKGYLLVDSPHDNWKKWSAWMALGNIYLSCPAKNAGDA